MKKHIPNLFTLLNLVSGTFAFYMVLQGSFTMAVVFIGAALVFDFLDGLAARLLHAGSEIGKQLDSLSDMVSFGLVSAAMIFMIFRQILTPGDSAGFTALDWHEKFLLASVVIVPVCAAIRLAKYNLQENVGVFYGLPVPANAIFWLGIYYEMMRSGTLFNEVLPLWFFWILMLFMAVLMIVPVPMLSLKIKNLHLKENFSRYLLFFISAVVVVFVGIPGLSIAILVYILISLSTIILT